MRTLRLALPSDNIKSVFDPQPTNEQLNLILAVLTERTVDSGHCIQFKNHYYRMMDKRGMQTHYRKGTKAMIIQAFDGSLYCCVNDKDIYALEEVPEREARSKEFDADYEKPTPKKRYIPPMNHPWRRQAFRKFADSQPHRIEEKIRQTA